MKKHLMYVELGKFTENFEKNIAAYYNTFLISHNDRTYAIVGNTNDINQDVCEESNVKVINIHHLGGTLVLTETAVGFAYVGEELTREFYNALVNQFVQYLQKRGLNAEHVDNDVMVDGYKIGSWTKRILPNEAHWFTFQISLDNDPELINKICTKPMKKVPKGLSEYGITKEEVITFLEDFVDKIEE